MEGEPPYLYRGPTITMVINQLPNGMIPQVPSMYGVPNMPYEHPMGVMFVDFCLVLGGLFQLFAKVFFFGGE